MMTAKRFGSLTPAGKRVAIAKDVLATLALPAAKRYKLERGTYCDGTPSTKAAQTAVDTATEFSQILPKIERDCRVCAIGAMFISHVRINNAVRMDSVTWRVCDTSRASISASDGFMIETMQHYFPVLQLRLIEQAFEGGWQEQYPRPKALLVAVCNNIIRNKGDFRFDQYR